MIRITTIAASLLTVALISVSGVVAAQQKAASIQQGLAPRLGVLGGLYSIDSDRNGRNSGESYGFQAGARYVARGLIGSRDVFADFSLERSANRAAISTAFARTDLTAYAGSTVLGVSPFVGYRMGFQSQSEGHSGLFATGLLEDNFFREGGPLVGAFGQIYKSEKLSAVAFAFINRTTVEYGEFELGRRDEKQNVYSLTFTLTPQQSPDNVYLIRYQRFGLSARNGEPGYDEDYLHLIYQRRWTFRM